jgi:hypothetical protein
MADSDAALEEFFARSAAATFPADATVLELEEDPDATTLEEFIARSAPATRLSTTAVQLTSTGCDGQGAALGRCNTVGL